MTRKYFYLEERTEALAESFRSKWAGRWPKNGPEWNAYDRDRQEVMDSIDRKVLDNPHHRAEYHRFTKDLIAGEPAMRVVDPVVTDYGSVGPVSADGYEAHLAQRAADIKGDL